MDILDALDVLAKLPTVPEMAKACRQEIGLLRRDRRKLQERLTAAEVAMGNFCDRVEAGEVRSRRTYSEFCEILGREPKQ